MDIEPEEEEQKVVVKIIGNGGFPKDYPPAKRFDTGAKIEVLYRKDKKKKKEEDYSSSSDVSEESIVLSDEDKIEYASEDSF